MLVIFSQKKMLIIYMAGDLIKKINNN
jgi:hypothetical protein